MFNQERTITLHPNNSRHAKQAGPQVYPSSVGAEDSGGYEVLLGVIGGKSRFGSDMSAARTLQLRQECFGEEVILPLTFAVPSFASRLPTAFFEGISPQKIPLPALASSILGVACFCGKNCCQLGLVGGMRSTPNKSTK